MAVLLGEPAGLEVLGLDRETGGDVLGHAVEPFPLLGVEGTVRVIRLQSSLIAVVELVAVGNQGAGRDQRMSYEVDRRVEGSANETGNIVSWSSCVAVRICTDSPVPRR